MWSMRRVRFGASPIGHNGGYNGRDPKLNVGAETGPWSTLMLMTNLMTSSLVRAEECEVPSLW